MARNKRTAINMSIAFLSVWSGFMLILYALIGVNWFHSGDFDLRTAMAYHGILIPAWLMLALAYFQHIDHSDSVDKLLGIGTIFASILTGIGSALIHDQGLSLGMVIQILGMIVAEIMVFVIIIKSFWHHCGTPGDDANTAAWWTVSIGLLGMSIATPLGHLAGAIKDLGEKFPLLLRHAELLGLAPSDAVNGYISSHSHQVVAAFLATAFALPLIRKSVGKPVIVNFMEKFGLFVMATATIAQITLYQYCAWIGWEPPDLFSNGPNGLPLDDFILVVLGLGMLLLIPGLLVKGTREYTSEDYSGYTDKMIAVLLLTYMISVVALGLYIEFHEQYFGHGEGNALGVPNDMAYIRAHLLFGFMVIPLLLGTLLNSEMIKSKWQYIVTLGITVLMVITGIIGTFLWTLLLNTLILKITIAFTAVFLLVFGAQLAIAWGNLSFSKNIEKDL